MTEHYLNGGDIFDAAAEAAGLGAYADNPMRERFIALIEHFNANKPVPEWALEDANEQLSSLVRTRLQYARDWALYPEIANQRIDQPFFVVGSGRTGSTAMQTLLALGDGCRTPVYWECWQPSPPRGLDPASESSRIAAEDRSMLEFINTAPGLLLSHPYFDEGGMASLEDEEIFTIDFQTASPMHFYKVPSLPIVHHKLETGLIDSLKFHKHVLQHLQWKQPTRHWVCKTTQHFFQLPVCWEVYPDAMCIWMHRDPVAFISSLLGLLHHLYPQVAGKVIRGQFAEEVVEGLRVSYETTLNADWLDDERVMHIRFDDFVRDHVGTIRRIYKYRGMEFTPEYEQRIQQWLVDPRNRSDRHGKFLYSLKQFGIDEADVRKKFKDYYQRFL